MEITEYGLKILKNGHSKLYVKKQYKYHTDSVRYPEEIFRLLNETVHLGEQAEEYVYIVAMNTQARILALFEVAHGTVDIAYVGNREILIRALLCGSSLIVVAHNHPGQHIKPSEADLKFTEKLKKACECVGIILADSMIITKTHYLSIDSSR